MNKGVNPDIWALVEGRCEPYWVQFFFSGCFGIKANFLRQNIQHWIYGGNICLSVLLSQKDDFRYPLWHSFWDKFYQLCKVNDFWGFIAEGSSICCVDSPPSRSAGERLEDRSSWRCCPQTVMMMSLWHVPWQERGGREGAKERQAESEKGGEGEVEWGVIFKFCEWEIMAGWSQIQRGQLDQQAVDWKQNRNNDTSRFFFWFCLNCLLHRPPFLLHHPPPQKPFLWICGDSSNSNSSGGNHFSLQASHYRSFSVRLQTLLSSPLITCNWCSFIFCEITQMSIIQIFNGINDYATFKIIPKSTDWSLKARTIAKPKIFMFFPSLRRTKLFRNAIIVCIYC